MNYSYQHSAIRKRLYLFIIISAIASLLAAIVYNADDPQALTILSSATALFSLFFAYAYFSISKFALNINQEGIFIRGIFGIKQIFFSEVTAFELKKDMNSFLLTLEKIGGKQASLHLPLTVGDEFIEFLKMRFEHIPTRNSNLLITDLQSENPDKTLMQIQKDLRLNQVVIGTINLILGILLFLLIKGFFTTSIVLALIALPISILLGIKVFPEIFIFDAPPNTQANVVGHFLVIPPIMLLFDSFINFQIYTWSELLMPMILIFITTLYIFKKCMLLVKSNQTKFFLIFKIII